MKDMLDQTQTQLQTVKTKNVELQAQLHSTQRDNTDYVVDLEHDQSRFLNQVRTCTYTYMRLKTTSELRPSQNQETTYCSTKYY